MIVNPYTNTIVAGTEVAGRPSLTLDQVETYLTFEDRSCPPSPATSCSLSASVAISGTPTTACPGRQVKKRLGPAFTGKGRPPSGHFTRKTAQVALDALLTDLRRGTVRS